MATTMYLQHKSCRINQQYQLGTDLYVQTITTAKGQQWLSRCLLTQYIAPRWVHTELYSLGNSYLKRFFLFFWEVTPKATGSLHRLLTLGATFTGPQALSRPCSNIPFLLPLRHFSNGSAPASLYDLMVLTILLHHKAPLGIGHQLPPSAVHQGQLSSSPQGTSVEGHEAWCRQTHHQGNREHRYLGAARRGHRQKWILQLLKGQ